MNKKLINLIAGTSLLTSCVMVNNYIDNKITERLDGYIEQYQQEQIENLREHAKGILENRVLLESQVSFVNPLNRRTYQTERMGNGYVVNVEGDNYIFTVDHVVNISSLDIQGLKIRVRSEPQTYLEGIRLEKIVEDVNRDIAIFEYPKELETPEYKINIGNSDELQPFDKVFIIGNPMLRGTIIRGGIIGNELSLRDSGEGINLSFNVSPGDSGNVVINEDGELVGLIKERHFDISGYMNPINWYLENLEDG